MKKEVMARKMTKSEYHKADSYQRLRKRQHDKAFKEQPMAEMSWEGLKEYAKKGKKWPEAKGAKQLREYLRD